VITVRIKLTEQVEEAWDGYFAKVCKHACELVVLLKGFNVQESSAMASVEHD
jgi:hypothetical protein